MYIQNNAKKAPAGSKTGLGNYLRLLRLERGFDNVSDYIRTYTPPISSSYYRDLENGRRLLSLDSAIQVCQSLEADTHAFFYNLLRDLLPSEAREIIVSPLPTSQHAADAIISMPEFDGAIRRFSYQLGFVPRSRLEELLSNIGNCGGNVS